MARTITDIGKLGVSSLVQSDISTAQTVDLLIDVERGSTINITHESETDQGEQTGYDGVTEVSFNDKTLAASLSKTKVKPNNVAFGAAMFTGNHSASAIGTGYRHTSVFDDPPNALDYFTMTVLEGASSDAPIDITRFIGNTADLLRVSGSRGGTVDMEIGVVGTGNDSRKKHLITVTQAAATTSLALTDTDSTDWLVAGSTDAERLDNVTIFAKDNRRIQAGDISAKVTPTAVSQATAPTTFTIPAFTPSGGASDAITYYIEFEVDDAQSGSAYAWSDDLDSLTVRPETELRYKSAKIIMGAGWDDTNGIFDGEVQDCVINSFELVLQRNNAAEQCTRTGTTVTDYATNIESNPYTATLSVDRRARDLFMSMLQYGIANNNTAIRFGVQFEMLGEVFDTAGPYYYRSQIDLPLIQAISKTHGSADNKWTRSMQFQILKDTSSWPAAPVARFITDNMWATYRA